LFQWCDPGVGVEFLSIWWWWRGVDACREWVLTAGFEIMTTFLGISSEGLGYGASTGVFCRRFYCVL
jgi:hypothetical protein